MKNAMMENTKLMSAWVSTVHCSLLPRARPGAPRPGSSPLASSSPWPVSASSHVSTSITSHITPLMSSLSALVTSHPSCPLSALVTSHFSCPLLCPLSAFISSVLKILKNYFRFNWRLSKLTKRQNLKYCFKLLLLPLNTSTILVSLSVLYILKLPI